MDEEFNEELIGIVKPFEGKKIPKDHLPCDGQILPVKDNEKFFSILGSTYGGDGSNTFALPKIKGHIIAAEGSYPQRGSSIVLDNPTLGEIKLFAGNYTPGGYASCDGQLLLIQHNTALFEVARTKFGGDGKTNFALPKMTHPSGALYVIAVNGLMPEK